MNLLIYSIFFGLEAGLVAWFWITTLQIAYHKGVIEGFRRIREVLDERKNH